MAHGVAPEARHKRRIIGVPWKADFVTHRPIIEDGQFLIPARPTWGTEVNETAVLARPPGREVAKSRIERARGGY